MRQMKMATCCYCGSRTTLVLAGEKQHELACGGSFQPRLKALPNACCRGRLPMDDDLFDCIIVGGGVAGLAAAMTLARGGAKFLLAERGEWR